jgi:hypothetical protein
MSSRLSFEAESFEMPLELAGELDELSAGLMEGEWDGEVSRSSASYIRWVQQALNRIMGLRLAADGVMGPATRSAIRSFQSQAGLTADGVVGPRTEAALRSRGAPAPPGAGGGSGQTSGGPVVMPPLVVTCPTLPMTVVVDGYSQNQTSVGTAQQSQLGPAVLALLRSLRPGCTQVRRVVTVGHASTEGSLTVNETVGRQRAAAVSSFLSAALGVLPALLPSPPVFEPPLSKGETEPVISPEASEADRRKNRRVGVTLMP